MNIEMRNIFNKAGKLLFVIISLAILGFAVKNASNLIALKGNGSKGSEFEITSADAGGSNKDARESIFANQNYLLPLEKIAVPVKKSDKADIDIAAKAVFAVDNATGAVFYEKNGNEKLPVASLTKLATALAIMELSVQNDKYAESKNKVYDLDRIVSVSPLAISQEGNSGALAEGEKIKARDLFSIMLIASSNDAAWALAEDAGSTLRNGGGVGDFVDLMNNIAEKERLKSTRFANPTGLDDKNNYSSARDVAKLAQEFFRYYPDYFAITAAERADFSSEDGKIKHHVENTNRLLGELSGIVGGKTGYTDEAGESLALIINHSASNSKIVAVVIGADDRFNEMKRLINWVWETYEWK